MFADRQRCRGSQPRTQPATGLAGPLPGAMQRERQRQQLSGPQLVEHEEIARGPDRGTAEQRGHRDIAQGQPARLVRQPPPPRREHRAEQQHCQRDLRRGGQQRLEIGQCRQANREAGAQRVMMPAMLRSDHRVIGFAVAQTADHVIIQQQVGIAFACGARAGQAGWAGITLPRADRHQRRRDNHREQRRQQQLRQPGGPAGKAVVPGVAGGQCRHAAMLCLRGPVQAARRHSPGNETGRNAPPMNSSGVMIRPQ